MKKKYSHIIWDWNGTLFDDVAWCMEVMNRMLIRREMSPLLDIQAYHKVFCFPIIEYYRNLGFNLDQEPFERLAVEFIEAYHSNKSGNSRLHVNAQTVLDYIHQNGMKQIILSASKIDNLLCQLKEFDINHYFDEILGLTDVYAKSKIDIGLDYLSKNNVEHALMIGDTVHDFEVATALGIDCLLISSGHQSRLTLASCGVPVLNDIRTILEYMR